jgi:hypothetical protein
MLTTLGQLRRAQGAAAIEFCGAVAQVNAGPATVSPTQEVGGIAGGNPHLADALRSASLHVDATAWVAVMRPTEPGATGRAARGFFDVFPDRAVFTLGRALLALGLQVSVVLPPNGHRCAFLRGV